jgi:cytochrome c peroxidase
MKFPASRRLWAVLAIASVLVGLNLAYAQQEQRGQTSYMPVDIKESFASIKSRMTAAKPRIEKEHADLLKDRYDLSNRAAQGATMSRGKPLQEGVRVKLPPGATWESLAAMSPEEIRNKNLFPKGFYPLPHPNHPEGGMVFPHFEIDEINKQEARDLTRFDLDFDLPDHFLPEFPAPIYLTTRPDLGDVSQGKLVTIENYYEIFNGILNPKELDGLRLLLTPFPQQQFNQTEDRRSVKPSRGVACLDCHANGHTNGATHLVGDIRPQEYRHRIETPSLRGVNIQRLFGSQRALKTVEDFTELSSAPRILTVTRLSPPRRASTSSNAAAKCMTWLNSRNYWTSHRHPSSTSSESSTPQRQILPSCMDRPSFSAKGNARAATRPPITPTTRCTTSRWSASTSP